MSKIIFIILTFISFNSKSNNLRFVLNASGGNSLIERFNKSYKVHYSIGQKGPIGIIRSKFINARQGFIQPPKFIETNSVIDKLFKVKITPNPFTEVLDIVFLDEIKDKVKIKIFDLMGRLVFKAELPKKTEHKIKLSSIQDSQFIIRLESEKKYFQKKIIKRN